MRLPKIVAFKVACFEKLKCLFRSSEGYSEPDPRNSETLRKC